MLCYKDRTFCSESAVCNNEACKLRFSLEDNQKATELGLGVCMAAYRQDPEMCFGFIPFEPDQPQGKDPENVFFDELRAWEHDPAR